SQNQPNLPPVQASINPPFSPPPSYGTKEELEEAELEEETLEQLMEEEANKEEKMDNAPKIKIQKDELPQIASLVSPCSIIAVIRDKLANIT
ncbi:2765_t:CDS:2, partial [Ambispora leptoticha]